MDDPREPVPSLGDAAALLMRSAAAQLRRAGPRRQPVAAGSSVAADAPIAPVMSVRLATVGRRSLVSRHVVNCAAVLLVIVASTAGLTWWSWQTLQDRQVQFGGERDLRRSSSDERTLVDDLVKREETGLDSPAAAASGQGPANLERPGPQLPTSTAKSISLDGRILAGAVIVTVLAAATGMSLLVVRHFRRKAAVELQALQTAPAKTWLDDLPDLPDLQPITPQEPETAPVMDEEDSAVSLDQPQDRNADEQVAALLVEQRRDGPEPEPTDEPILVDRVEPPPAASWPVGPPTADAGTGVALKAPLAPEAVSYDDLAPEAAARERIFDRRVSRRVPYVKPAWLWWAEQNAPVTVQDLSLTGLRCLLASPAGAASPAAPALGDQVRVFFPVNKVTVKATARVQWKEHTPQGIQVGVEFVDLPADDVAAVRQLLVEVAD
jgi:hypothetical protein